MIQLASQHANLERSVDLMFQLVDVTKTTMNVGQFIGGANTESKIIRCQKFMLIQLCMLLNYNNFDHLFEKGSFYDYACQKTLTSLQDYSNDTMELIGG